MEAQQALVRQTVTRASRSVSIAAEVQQAVASKGNAMVAVVRPYLTEAGSEGELAYRLWPRGLELTLAEVVSLGAALPPGQAGAVARAALARRRGRRSGHALGPEPGPATARIDQVLGSVTHLETQIQRELFAEEPDAFRALARYLHRALDARIGAVMPGLAEQLPAEDAQLRQTRNAITASVHTMIEAAQAEGTLRADIAFGDISLLLVRLARPLPGPIPLELDSQLAHRQLELLLAGPRAAPNVPPAPLPAPALTLADLHALRKASDRTVG